MPKHRGPLGPHRGPPALPHGPHHHPGHHGPEWIVSVEDDVTRGHYASHLTAIAEALAATGKVQINDTTVSIPETIEFVLRYERTPYGSYALLLRAEWDGNDDGHSVSAAGLQISPPNGSAAA